MFRRFPVSGKRHFPSSHFLEAIRVEAKGSPLFSGKKPKVNASY
jgi:hypothetical protein